MSYALAFAGGVAGSLHCIGMCGGLVAILAAASPGRPWGRVLAYNLARVGTLAVIGAVAGGFGATIVAWGPVAGAQRVLAIVAGAVMTVVGLEVLGVMAPRGQRLAAALQSNLGRALGEVVRARSVAAPIALGTLNAFLPCHLVYGFAAMAAGTGSPGRGYLTMLAFGLGTLPAMVAPAAVRSMVGASGGGRVQRAAGVLVVAIGMLTVARGLVPSGHVH